MHHIIGTCKFEIPLNIILMLSTVIFVCRKSLFDEGTVQIVVICNDNY
jgi:hypothetical protein